MDHLACWEWTMEKPTLMENYCLKKGQTNGEKLTLTWRDTYGHSGHWLSWTFSLCLIIVGTALCVYYMYLSYIVYQIFISISFKLNIFRTSLVTMLWITLKHCGTFIVVWGMCWLCAGTHVSRYTSIVDVNRRIGLLLYWSQNMTEDQKHKSSSSHDNIWSQPHQTYCFK